MWKLLPLRGSAEFIAAGRGFWNQLSRASYLCEGSGYAFTDRAIAAIIQHNTSGFPLLINIRSQRF